jgi:chromosome segregation ATPase
VTDRELLELIFTEITGLKAGQERLEGEMTGLKAGQERLEGEITGLKAGQERLEGEMTGLKAGQERLEGEITGLKAVDKVRRMEQKFEPDLKSTRFLWLYNQDNLKQEQLEKLETLKNTNLKTAKAYQLKLTLQEIYENATDRIEAMIILKKWYNWAVRCRLEPIDNAETALLLIIQKYFSS